MIGKLLEYGFVPTGFWGLTYKQKTPLAFYIDEELALLSEVLYAFVANEQVIYIGITSNSLRERMKGYKYGKKSARDSEKIEASTNKKLHKVILGKLKENKTIDIYVLHKPSLGEYMGLSISPISGIEHSLIKEFDEGQLLNDRGKKSTRKVKKQKKDGNRFQMTLLKEYFNKGKIGFGKASIPFLPKQSSVPMVINLGKRTIIGTFTISGNTVSVNGKKDLKEWYASNCKLGDKVWVEIIDHKNIKLTKL